MIGYYKVPKWFPLPEHYMCMLSYNKINKSVSVTSKTKTWASSVIRDCFFLNVTKKH